MTPIESLCFECLKHWWWVVEQKHGSCGEIDSDGQIWTRVSASEVAAWIKGRFDCKVTTRQCQNALRALERDGRVVREKRWKHAHCQAYSYRSTNQQQSIDEPQATSRLTSSDSSASKEPVNQIYLSPTSSTKKVSTGESDVDDGASKVGAFVAPPPAPPVVKRVSTLVPPGKRRSLSSILELCEAIGRGDKPNPAARCDPQDPSTG